jgi:hypothetical protein
MRSSTASCPSTPQRAANLRIDLRATAVVDGVDLPAQNGSRAGQLALRN